MIIDRQFHLGRRLRSRLPTPVPIPARLFVSGRNRFAESRFASQLERRHDTGHDTPSADRAVADTTTATRSTPDHPPVISFNGAGLAAGCPSPAHAPTPTIPINRVTHVRGWAGALISSTGSGRLRSTRNVTPSCFRTTIRQSHGRSLPAVVGLCRCKEPGKIRTIKFDCRKIIWLEIRGQMTRLCAYDLLRIDACDIARAVESHLPLNVGAVVDSQLDRTETTPA